VYIVRYWCKCNRKDSVGQNSEDHV